MIFKVLSPLKTIHRVLAGRLSLARIGDGEMGLAVCEASSRGQDYSPDLGKALRRVARAQVPGLLVAIPDIFVRIPPEKFRWERWTSPERTRIFDPDITYGNAFCSRPDYYGHPFGPEYWNAMRRIWEGRDVLLVRGDEKRPALFDNAGRISVMVAANRNAWSEYRDVRDQAWRWIAEWHPEGLVIAALGPTATVLAWDLAKCGIQCLDIGKAERFYRHEMLKDAA